MQKLRCHRVAKSLTAFFKALAIPTRQVVAMVGVRLRSTVTRPCIGNAVGLSRERHGVRKPIRGKESKGRIKHEREKVESALAATPALSQSKKLLGPLG